MSFFTRLVKYSEDQARDEHGRWTASGGGDVFVSPNVEQSMNFHQALEGLSSARHLTLRKVSNTIHDGLRIDAKDQDCIGAWSDGAENSIMTIVPHASFEQLKVEAAMKGHLADQKSALVFKENPTGKAVLFSFDAKGDLADIHKSLINDGVYFHTLVPQAGGAKVYACDMHGDLVNAVEKGAKRYGAEVSFVRGHAELVGTKKEHGTDREIRDDARNKYERVIEGSRVQGASSVWHRLHSTYGDNLGRQAVAKGVEDEPRDAHGKWTSSGAAQQSTAKTPKSKTKTKPPETIASLPKLKETPAWAKPQENPYITHYHATSSDGGVDFKVQSNPEQTKFYGNATWDSIGGKQSMLPPKAHPTAQAALDYVKPLFEDEKGLKVKINTIGGPT